MKCLTDLYFGKYQSLLCAILSLGILRATSISLYYGVSGESRVATIVYLQYTRNTSGDFIKSLLWSFRRKSSSYDCYFTGIGKSIAQALLKCGAEVIVLEKIEADLQKFKEEVIRLY